MADGIISYNVAAKKKRTDCTISVWKAIRRTAKNFQEIPANKQFKKILSSITLRKYVLSRFSHVWLCDPMDCSPPGFSAHGISQQENWSRLPFPIPGGLPDPGIEPRSPALTGGFFTVESPGKPNALYIVCMVVAQSCLTLWDPLYRL